MVEKVEYFACDFCGEEHLTEAEAEECEKVHAKLEERESKRRQYEAMTKRIKRWNKFLDEKGVHEKGES